MNRMNSSGLLPESSTPLPTASSGEDDQLRKLVSELISASTNLDIRMWLDGIYTEIADPQSLGDWMKGREVYFKIEGKVDDLIAPGRSGQ